MEHFLCLYHRDGKCSSLSVQPPKGYFLTFPQCDKYLNDEDRLKYFDELKELIEEYPDSVCPICQKKISEINVLELTKLGCCGNFMCRKCIVDDNSSCKICRQHSSEIQKKIIKLNFEKQNIVFDPNEILEMRKKYIEDIRSLERSYQEIPQEYGDIKKAISKKINFLSVKVFSDIKLSYRFTAFSKEEGKLESNFQISEIEPMIDFLE